MGQWLITDLSVSDVHFRKQKLCQESPYMGAFPQIPAAVRGHVTCVLLVHLLDVQDYDDFAKVGKSLLL
jgi:hypothetical protein